MLRIFIILLIAGGCSKKIQSVTGQNQKLLEMSKSPCFGFCPVYHLVVFEDGLMRLTAKQNMKISGTYTKQLSTAEIKAIKSRLDKMKLLEFQDEYREPVADAPSTELLYYKDKTMKKIVTNFLFPEPLQNLTEELNHHTQSENWVIWTDPRIRTEFIVLLHEGVALSGLLPNYRENELMMVKRLDPVTTSYWLLSALVNPGEENLLLSKLKKEPGVKEAQLNRSLDNNR